MRSSVIQNCILYHEGTLIPEILPRIVLCFTMLAQRGENSEPNRKLTQRFVTVTVGNKWWQLTLL